MNKRLSRLLAAVLLSIPAVALAGSAQAACADPLSMNDPHTYLSASGVEVDWHIRVKSGCSGRFRVVVFRDTTAVPTDVQSAQVSGEPTVEYGAGLYTLNGMLPVDEPGYQDPAETRPGWALLYINGVVFRILPLDPSGLT